MTELAQGQESADDGGRVEGKAYVERIELHFKRERKTGNPMASNGAKVEIKMLPVPAGQFKMGNPNAGAGEASQRPAHDVRLSAFWMSECEITQDLFYEWVYAYRAGGGKGPQPETTRAPLKDLPVPDTPYLWPDYRHFDDYDGTRPATALTQYAAQQFCRWLSARTGRTYRLPTEAEWEYAAKAGKDQLWPSGATATDLAAHAWFNGELEKGSHPVGRKRPNAWGFRDMCGNAAEWVLDGWLDDYGLFAGKVSVDPWVRREPGQRYGVVRGGDWTGSAADARITVRRKQNDWIGRGVQDDWKWYDLSGAGRVVGFRVVSPVAQETDGRESYLEMPKGQ